VDRACSIGREERDKLGNPFCQLVPDFLEGVERLVSPPVRERGEDRDTAVNTDRRQCGFQRVGDFFFPRRADVPALGLVAERDRRQPAAERSVTLADLGKPDGAVILGETAECDVLGWQREGVVQERPRRRARRSVTRGPAPL
jgi:hypothetical protein